MHPTPSLAEQIAILEGRRSLLDALATALADVRRTVGLIAEAPDHDAARESLRAAFGFDLLQAAVVLDMQFRHAAAQQRDHIAREREEVARQLADLRRAQTQHAAVVRHYDGRAATYDESAMHRGLAEAVADLVGDPGEDVVDVATGTGLVLRAIAARWPAARLTGVDLSEQMLAAGRGALPRASWLRGDAAALPLASGSADVLTCVTALHLLPRPQVAYQEWARVLRRRGRLVTATFTGPASPDEARRHREGQQQDPERRHDAFRTPQQVAAPGENVGLAVVEHTTWRHGADELLLCVLRRSS